MKLRLRVFRIVNLVNGEIFIGCCPDLLANWHAECLQLKMGIHCIDALQSDWKQLGVDNFKYLILEEMEQSNDHGVDWKKELKALEEMMLDELQLYNDKGYNRKRG
jgi:hypothetical protein